MASFTEQATLKVNDQSSAAIAKINAELKKLDATARSLKNKNINIKIDDKGLTQAVTKLAALHKQLSGLHSARINLNVNTSALTQAQNRINQLRQNAARAINVNMRAAGGAGAGGAGAGTRAGANRRGLRQTGIGYQMGNFSPLRGAASVVIGGTVYAVAANVTRSAVSGVMDSEDARMRLRQSGFDKPPEIGPPREGTPQTDWIMAMARKSQEQYQRIPAAEIANAAVEQLNALRANNAKSWEYQAALDRIAANAQTMTTTFKDSHEGAEAARQLERVSQIMGQDVDNTKIRAIQDAAMRAIIATGGEIKPEEAVRSLQQLGSTVTKGLSPMGLTNLLLVRDEGGRQSTAEFRTAIQDLQKDSLNKKDKAAQAALGLRQKGGTADPAMVKEATSDLVDFTKNRIMPLLEKAGVDQTSSSDVGTWLDKHGFSTSGARAFAAIVTNLKSGEFQRQQAAAQYVDLDPHLGDNTFRGGSERLSASFQTALARSLDKMGPAFAEAIAPFSIAMDKAGKAAELGNYSEATGQVTKGIAQMMGGPAGAIMTAVAGASAIKTFLDPRSTPFEKAAAMMLTAGSSLLTAAGYITNAFGAKDPEKDLMNLQELKRTAPAELDALKKRLAEEEAKPLRGDINTRRNMSTVQVLGARIAALEAQNRTIDAEIAAAEARVAALKEQKAKEKVQEAEDMEELRRKAGLGGGEGGAAAVSPTAPKSAISDATVQQLRQLSAGGKLDGVKSITELLKALNQPTSVKAREELARKMGYTGPGGGSAAMNEYLLKVLKLLATTPEPPKVEPPKEEPPKTPPPPIALPPLPTVPGFTPISFTSLVDPASMKSTFNETFSSGASTIGNAGTTVGTNAAGELNGRAGAIGGAIGSAAAAIISAARVQVDVPQAIPGARVPASPGAQTVPTSA
jgi:hypothetical protein